MRVRTLTEQALRVVCPSLFCQKQAEHLSEYYQFCPTWPVVQGLIAKGWHVISARQQGRLDTAKHLVRLIQGTPDSYGRIELEQAETFVLALFGSHDGSKALNGLGGILVKACLNGLFVAEQTLGAFRFVHRTCNGEQINQALNYFAVNFTGIQSQIEAMKGTTLTSEAMQNFAVKAISIRWGELSKAPRTVTSLALLHSNRYTDQGDSLWHVFNRIQENVVNHRIRDVKAIRSVSEDVRINQALWDYATTLIAK